MMDRIYGDHQIQPTSLFLQKYRYPHLVSLMHLSCHVEQIPQIIFLLGHWNTLEALWLHTGKRSGDQMGGVRQIQRPINKDFKTFWFSFWFVCSSWTVLIGLLWDNAQFHSLLQSPALPYLVYFQGWSLTKGSYNRVKLTSPVIYFTFCGIIINLLLGWGSV